MKMKFILTVFGILSFSIMSLADPPLPPGNPGTGGGGGGPVGAPIDGGLGILLAMGAIYGGRKLYKARKDKKEKESTEEAIAEQ